MVCDMSNFLLNEYEWMNDHSNLQISPAQQKFPKKLTFALPGGCTSCAGVHLQIFPENYV